MDVFKGKVKIEEEFYDEFQVENQNCYETDMDLGFNVKEVLLDPVGDLPEVKNNSDNDLDLKERSIYSDVQEQPYNSSMFKKEPKFEYEDSQQFVTMDNSSLHSSNVNEMLISNENDISSQTNQEMNFECKIKREELHSICDLPNFKMEFQNFDNELQSERRIKRYSRKQSQSCKKRFLSAAKKWQPHFGKFYGTCSSCGKFFYDKLLFLNHFYMYHCLVNSKKSVNLRRNNSATKHINLQELSNLNKQIGAGNFTQQTNFEKCIKTHIAEKHFKCKICSKGFTRPSHLKTHIRTHTDEKPFKCEICSKCFIYSISLKRHITTHSDEKPYQCKICSKCFTDSSGLKSHIRTHTDEKPFKCEICSKFFKHSSNLNRHIRTHTDGKPFKCKICSKCFTESSNLNRHIRTHTDEKHLKCKICSKCFKQSSHLKSHIRIHTDEKTFKCNICSKFFTQSSHLKTHIRTHTGEKPFKCEICSKCFTRPSHLQTHIRTHTNEKPFKCEICSKCFYRSSCLKVHIKTHTDEKPFNCEICAKCFKNSFSLKSHIKTH